MRIRILARFVLIGLISTGSVFCLAQVTTEAPSVRDLLLKGAELQRQGFYLDAQAGYFAAYRSALANGNAEQTALAETALGYGEYLLNHAEQAEPYLKHALAYARQSGNRALSALALYYLGLVKQVQILPEQAEIILRLSLEEAERIADPLLVARIRIAMAQHAGRRQAFIEHQRQALDALAHARQFETTGEIYLTLAEQLLDHPLFPELDPNARSVRRTENGLSNGAVAADASTPTPADSADYVEYAYRLLETGRPRLDPGNARHQARYYALTGQLYEIRERYEEALRATAEAIRLLQGQRAEDLLLFYEWQAGRLFKALNHRQAALAAYRRAAGYVDAIRGDIPVTYHNGRSSFLELFGPLYRGLLDLLLQNVEDGASPRIERARLEEARGMMERLKQTELEDFFHDRCLLTGFEAYRKRLSELGLAVLYPVILDDRLELLLIIGDEYERFSVQVPASLFETSVRDFAAALREGSDDTLAGSRRLYDWLIRPWAGRLDEAHIDTLVYIPDGPLRLLPLAALHDGRKYLIERLAITTLPSLAVLPERSKPTAKGVVLLVGLSKPGPETVTELPETLLEQLRLASAESTERSLAHGAVRSIAYRSEQSESGRIEPKADLEKLAEVLSLPGVEKEVATLAEIQRSRVVLNRDYTLQHFDLLVRQPLHHMIHIASHGFFGGTSDSSFIMTYDRILTMDHLQQLLEQRSTDEPIDMLVLSACQTAEGDDRAPLGLSGVALKARADSALGSLWPISDEAAVKLMKGFYSGITQQRLSKAKALQQAQLSLLRDANLAHPFYWSPFVLVGHW